MASKVHWLSFASVWLFSALSWPRPLQLPKWLLRFSPRYFGPHVVKSVSLRKEGWNFLFLHLVDPSFTMFLNF